MWFCIAKIKTNINILVRKIKETEKIIINARMADCLNMIGALIMADIVIRLSIISIA